jgi:hypothetical protein
MEFAGQCPFNNTDPYPGNNSPEFLTEITKQNQEDKRRFEPLKKSSCQRPL